MIFQLSNTKDIENKESLMHYLVKTIEKNFPECLSFAEELSHVNKASRLSLENIKETLTEINKQIKILEQDLVNWNVPPSELDRFVEVMSLFAEETRASFEVLRNMLEKMDALYTDLSEFFTFDKKKYDIEEFFGDIKKFIDDFLVCIFIILIARIDQLFGYFLLVRFSKPKWRLEESASGISRSVVLSSGKNPRLILLNQNV